MQRQVQNCFDMLNSEYSTGHGRLVVELESYLRVKRNGKEMRVSVTRCNSELTGIHWAKAEVESITPKKKHFHEPNEGEMLLHSLLN